MKTLLIISSLALIVISSCNLFGPDWSLVDPEFPIVYLNIVNERDSSLLGSELQYHPDSVLLFTAKDTLDIMYADNYNKRRLYFHYWDSPETDTYYLQLEASDVDTIKIYCHFQSGECYNYRVIDSLKYNSNLVDPEMEADTYKIIKLPYSKKEACDS